MTDDSFIWQPWPIESIDDILGFEERYRYLVKNTPEEWSPETGFISHDFGDGNLDFMSAGHFRMMAEDASSSNDVFIKAGCTECESLVLHSFLSFESGLYRIDSYNNQIPPIVAELCHLLDKALDKLPHNNDSPLYRVCVFEDREDFKLGEIFEPRYSLTTSADSSWRDYTVNRYVITPLCAEQTLARAIYRVENKAKEFQVSFLSNVKFLVKGIEDWGHNKKAYLMEETPI